MEWNCYKPVVLVYARLARDISSSQGDWSVLAWIRQDATNLLRRRRFLSRDDYIKRLDI